MYIPRTFLLLPRARLSEIRTETATGIPAVDIIYSVVYTAYAELTFAISSPKIELSGTLYKNPNIFPKMFASASTKTPESNSFLSVFSFVDGRSFCFIIPLSDKIVLFSVFKYYPRNSLYTEFEGIYSLDIVSSASSFSSISDAYAKCTELSEISDRSGTRYGFSIFIS